MLNLDPAKLLVIGVVAIILLGPDRLFQVARQLGGAWRSFNEFRHRMESEVRNTMPDLPPTSEIARLARSPSALLNHLSNMSTDEAPDGSFQPPSPPSENGTAAAAEAVGPRGVRCRSFSVGDGAPPPAPEQFQAAPTPPLRPREPEFFQRRAPSGRQSRPVWSFPATRP